MKAARAMQVRSEIADFLLKKRKDLLYLGQNHLIKNKEIYRDRIEK